jgi:Tfp pilus assembly protein PilZ
MKAGRHHAGIVIGSQQRYSVGEQLRRLLRLLDRNTAETMCDRVEFLSGW